MSQENAEAEETRVRIILEAIDRNRDQIQHKYFNIYSWFNSKKGKKMCENSNNIYCYI